MTFGPIVALVLTALAFGAADYARKGPRATFLTVNSIRGMSEQTVVVATAALGMTVIVIAGGIDLASGTALALSATVLAWCLRENYGTAISLAAAAGVGAVTGLINGALISLLRVVPFIITLGMMSIYLGAAKKLSGGTTVTPKTEQVPEWLSGLNLSQVESPWLIQPVLPHFPPAVWICAALAVALAAVLKYTVFGKHVFAIGSNEATARLCGVNVARTKIAVYMLAGLFVGVAGILQFTRLSSGDPTGGIGMELRIITAVVIGGGSLKGGRGSVAGTIAGAALMVVIYSGCNVLLIDNAWTDMLVGVILIAAAAVDEFRRRRAAD
jgi:ribose transport system permease protein